MSHPIMHAIGNVAVVVLWLVGIPLSAIVPSSPQVVRLERSVERLERAVERLESERPVMQQTNNVNVPQQPGEIDMHSLAREALANIQEKRYGTSKRNEQRDAVLHAGGP